VRDSKFSDRLFVAVVLLAILGLLAGVAISLMDQQPQGGLKLLFLQTAR
jgi:hypothetical protein